MLTLEQIDEALKKRGVPIPGAENVPRRTLPQTPSLTLEQIDAALAKRGAQVPEQGGALHRLGQFARGAVSSTGGFGDLVGNFPQMIPGSEEFTEELGKKIYKAGLTRDQNVPYKPMEMGNLAEELPQFVGLDKRFKPGKDDTTGKILEGAGAFMAPPFGSLGVAAKALPAGAKAVAKVLGKEAGMAGATSAAIYGTPRIAEEGTIPGAIEDVAKGLTVPFGIGSSSGLYRKIKAPKFTSNEKAVGEYLHDVVGKENVPEVAERLRSYESPIGYKPTTAEIAESPSLAQIQRAQQGIAGSGVAEHQGRGVNTIINALKEMEPSEKDLRDLQEHVSKRLSTLEKGVEKEKQTLSPKMEAPETGRAIQEGLHQSLEEKKAVRRAAAKPYYESAEHVEKEINPFNAKRFLRKTVARGDVEKDLNEFKGMIKSRTKLTPSDIAYKKSYENTLKEMEKIGPKYVEDYVKNNPAPKSMFPTAQELMATDKAITAKIQDYRVQGGKNQQVLMLSKAQKALRKDLESIPDYATARAIHKELSPPVNEILKQPTLKRVVRRVNKDFTMTESRVPEKFINTSAGSIDDAKALLKQLYNKPEALQSTRAYLNELASKKIVNPRTGEVDVNNLEAFKNKYPGAKVLYPDLYNYKLDNIKNAQNMVNQYQKKMEKVADTLYKDALGNYGKKDSRHLIKSLFDKNSTENMNTIIKELEKQGDIEAMEGLRRETINHFQNSITNAGAVGSHNALSYNKMKNFMKEHGKAMQEVLEPEQFKVVNEVEKIILGQNKAATLGAAPGSPTAANIRNALDMSKQTGFGPAGIRARALKIGAGTPLIKEMVKGISELRLLKNEEILNKALLEPDYAAMLMMKPLENKENLKQFVKAFKENSKPRYLSPITAHLLQEDNEEKK